MPTRFNEAGFRRGVNLLWAKMRRRVDGRIPAGAVGHLAAYAASSCVGGMQGTQRVTERLRPSANHVVPVQMASIHLPSCNATTVLKASGLSPLRSERAR